jgi:hypothetical protein
MVLKLCFQHRLNRAHNFPQAGLSFPVALIQLDDVVEAVGNQIKCFITNDRVVRRCFLIKRRPAHGMHSTEQPIWFSPFASVDVKRQLPVRRHGLTAQRARTRTLRRLRPGLWLGSRHQHGLGWRSALAVQPAVVAPVGSAWPLPPLSRSYCGPQLFGFQLKTVSVCGNIHACSEGLRPHALVGFAVSQRRMISARRLLSRWTSRCARRSSASSRSSSRNCGSI